MKKFLLFLSLLLSFSLGAKAADISIDLASNAPGFGTGSSNNSGKCTDSASGVHFEYKNTYYNTSKYLMFSSGGSLTMTLPSNFVCSQVKLTTSSTSSEKGTVSLSINDQPIITNSAINAKNTEFTLEIPETNQTAGANLVLSNSSSNNIQFTKLVFVEASNSSATPDPAGGLVDEITIDNFSNITGTTYTFDTYTSSTTGVTYAICAGKNGGIQMNSTAGKGGLVITKNDKGYKVKNITIAFSTAKDIDFYSNTTAYTYSQVSDFALTLAGTKTAKAITSTNTSYDVTNGTPFWGIKSNSGAAVITKITVTYEDEKETVATPTFSPNGGQVALNSTVTISSATTGADIYYTTDGTNPSTSSTKGNTVSVDRDMTIKAIAVKAGMENSEVASATFTVADSRKDPQMKWSVDEFTARYGDTNISWPTFSSAFGRTAVHFKSSTPSVADIALVSGEITLNNVNGTTVITAEFDGDSTYKPGSASYTLTVKEALKAYVAPFANSNIELTEGSTQKLDFGTTSPTNGLKFEVTNGGDVISISNDGTITANKVGSASVTLSWDADDTFTAGSTNFTVTITEKPQTADVTYDFANNNYGETVYSGNDNNYSANGTVLTESPIKLEINPGKAGAGCRFWNTGSAQQFRIMKGSNIRLFIDNGNITKVTFAGGALTPEDGKSTVTTWEGKASSITFTNPSSGSTVSLTSITVTYEGGTTVDPGRKTEVTLSFPKDSYDATMGEAFDAPTASASEEAAKKYIVYESTDKKVATVNGSSGKVELVGAGVTEIKASLSDNDKYEAATVSYILNVTNNSQGGETPEGDVYVLVTNLSDITTDGEYIWVSYHDNKYLALSNSTSSNKFTGVEVNNNGSNQIIVKNEDVQVLKPTSISDNSMAWKSGSKYLVGQNNGTNLTLVTSATNSTVTIEDGKAKIVYPVTNNTARQILYNGSLFGHYAQSNASESTYSVPSIYKKSSGEVVPPTPTLKDYTALNDYAENGISFIEGGTAKVDLGSEHPTISYAYDPEGIVTIAEDGTITAQQIGSTNVTASWSADEVWNEGTAQFTVTVKEKQMGDPEAEKTEWKKVTSASDLQLNTEYIIAATGSAKVSGQTENFSEAMAVPESGIDYMPSGSVIIDDDGTITISEHENKALKENIAIVTFEGESFDAAKLKITAYDGEIKGYYTTTAAKAMSLGSGTEASISYVDGKVTIDFDKGGDASLGILYFNYNSGKNSRYLNYTSTQTSFDLYKKLNDNEMTEVTMFWTIDNEQPIETLAVDMADTEITWPHVFTDPEDITQKLKYSSDDDTVAVIDENTGEITLKGEGDATITAKFEGTDTLTADETSFVLTVSDSRATEDNIDKDFFDANGTYTLRQKSSDVTGVTYNGKVSLSSQNLQINTGSVATSSNYLSGIASVENTKGLVIESILVEQAGGTGYINIEVGNTPAETSEIGNTNTEAFVMPMTDVLQTSKFEAQPESKEYHFTPDVNAKYFRVYTNGNAVQISNLKVIYKEAEMRDFEPQLEESYTLILDGENNVLDLKSVLGEIRPQNIELIAAASDTQNEDAVEIDEENLTITGVKKGSVSIAGAWSDDATFNDGDFEFTVVVMGKTFADPFNEEYTLRLGETLDLNTILGAVENRPENITVETVNEEANVEDDILSEEGLVLTADYLGSAMVSVDWDGETWESGYAVFMVTVTEAPTEYQDNIAPQTIESLLDTSDNSYKLYSFVDNSYDAAAVEYGMKVNNTANYYVINSTSNVGKNSGLVTLANEKSADGKDLLIKEVIVKRHTSPGSGTVVVNFGNTAGQLVYNEPAATEPEEPVEGEEIAPMAINPDDYQGKNASDYSVEMTDVEEVLTDKDVVAEENVYTFAPTGNYKYLLIQTAGGAANIAEIKVVYTTVANCPIPTFEPVSGSYIYGESKVEINAENKDVTIHYTVNEGEEQTYDAETGVTFDADGTYTVTAWTTKEGWTDSATASATYYYKTANPYEKYVAQLVTDDSEIEDGALYVLVGYNTTREKYEVMTNDLHSKDLYLYAQDVTGDVDTDNDVIELNEGMAIVKFEKDGEFWHLNTNGKEDHALYVKSVWGPKVGSKDHNDVTLVTDKEDDTKATVTLVKAADKSTRVQIVYPQVEYTVDNGDDSEEEIEAMAVETRVVTPMLQYNASSSYKSRFAVYDNTLTNPYLYRLYLPFDAELKTNWSLVTVDFDGDEEFVAENGYELEAKKVNYLTLNVKVEEAEANTAENVTYEVSASDFHRPELKKEVVTSGLTVEYLPYEALTDKSEVYIQATVDGEKTVKLYNHEPNIDDLFNKLTHDHQMDTEKVEYTISGTYIDHVLHGIAQLKAPYNYSSSIDNDDDYKNSFFEVEYLVNDIDDAEVTYDNDNHIVTIDNLFLFPITKLDNYKQDLKDAIAEMDFTVTTNLHYPFIYLEEPVMAGDSAEMLRPMADTPAAYQTKVFTSTYTSTENAPDVDDDGITSGVEDVVVDNDAEVVYYNLQGVRVDNPREGQVYIRVCGQEVEKVHIR